MLIFVSRLDGAGSVFEVEPRDTVLWVKEKIEKKEGIPPNKQRLVFSGAELEDSRTLLDYNVKDKSILTAIS